MTTRHPHPGDPDRTVADDANADGASIGRHLNSLAELREAVNACRRCSLWRHATQGVPVPDLFDQKHDGVAWKTKPSWYIVGAEDHTVHPELQRAAAKRMGATTVELRSSHVPMLSQPAAVLDVIRAAAKAATAAERAA